MIIHNDYYEKIHKNDYKIIKPYFRIRHDIGSFNAYSLPSNYSIIEVDPKRELPTVAKFICKCYENIKPSHETVKIWTEHPL